MSKVTVVVSAPYTITKEDGGLLDRGATAVVERTPYLESQILSGKVAVVPEKVKSEKVLEPAAPKENSNA